jgi:hypothetical protein
MDMPSNSDPLPRTVYFEFGIVPSPSFEFAGHVCNRSSGLRPQATALFTRSD